MKKTKIVSVLLVFTMLLGAVSCAQETSSHHRRKNKDKDKKNKKKVERVAEETSRITEIMSVETTAAATEAPLSSESTAATETYVSVTYPVSDFFTVYSGSDYKSLEFYTNSSFTTVANSYLPNGEGIYIKFQTKHTYDASKKFYVDVKIDNQLIVDHLQGNIEDPVGTNWGDISLSGPIPEGNYEIIITGFDGNILATAYFII